MLNEMFSIVYNTEVLNEDDFFEWEKNGTELFGRRNAVMSVKNFFEWLRSDTEDQHESLFI